jgi:hypothetical protein
VIGDQGQALSLEDLEAFDPGAPATGRERRFLCPMSACEAKQRGSRHRSLTVNVETGAWHCWRCRASGKVRERWEARRRTLPALARARRACGLDRPVAPSAMLRPRLVDLDTPTRRLQSLEGSPGARYLKGRGIPIELAAAAGVQWAPNWYGRAAVVFPLRDRGGQLVALAGRHIDRADPKAHDCGPKAAGVFAMPGAWEAFRVVITEAPIDALSLAAVGVPALALCGTNMPAWLPRALAFRTCVLAPDDDAAGDTAR